MSKRTDIQSSICVRLRELFLATTKQSRQLLAQSALAGCLLSGGGVLLLPEAYGQDAPQVDLAKESADNEAAMLAVLRSDAPNAEKAIACKRLAVYGSGAAVADVAPLLANPELSSWARIALEAIPGKEADEALRTSAGSLQGRILVGVINSIGVRRDAGAVDVLLPHLKGQDPEAAAAAAVALGRIGTEPARVALLESLADPADSAPVTAVAEGCVLAAERLLAEGQADAAASVYDAVLNSQAPKPRIVEATRGAILARGEQGIPLLLEKLKSEDKGIYQIALSTAREMEGKAVDSALAAELANLEPDHAALVVYAMADRTRTVNLEAILAAAGNGPLPVRIAAVQALRKIGNASCVPALIEIAQETDADLNALARLALAELPGKDVDGQISSQLSKASGKKFVLLIQLVGERRIDAVATLVKALDNSDSAVRRASLVALGETVPLDKLSVLINQATGKKDPEEAQLAFQALKTASVRMGDREACAAQLSSAVDKTTSVPAKCSLLEVLGSVGGTKALEAMNKAARSSTPELQDTSSKLLGEWMTEDAAPVLLDLAKTVPGEKYKVRALRGYIRIARQFVLPDEQRVQMCVRAMEAARQPAEKKLVVEILKRYPNMDTLKLAIKALDTPDVKTEASEAILVIASKIGTGNPEVLELIKNAGLEKVKIEIVKAEYGADANQKDVTEIIQKSTGDLPLITLPAETYNAAFGGDPAPGVQKKLRIQYRFNGKDGEVNLAENAILILPAPGSEVRKK